jgi:hypothetical protein
LVRSKENGKRIWLCKMLRGVVCVDKRPAQIAPDLKKRVVKKFLSADKQRYVVVLRGLDSYTVAWVSKLFGEPVAVETFVVPFGESEVPAPVWSSANRELAIWCARHYARKGSRPSINSERLRRKKYLGRALRAFKAHLETKTAIAPPVVPKPFVKPTVVLPWIVIYKPKDETTFHVHTAYCSDLDKDRRKAVRRGGVSWVIEAKTAEEAIAKQLMEFTVDDKGYDQSDFAVHSCWDHTERPVLGKTVLGRVGRKRR